MTTVLDRVLDAARRTPDAVALVDAAGATTSYRELATAVDGLASALLRQVGPGNRIAVVSTKQPGTVLAMLAVLRAGCAYVPVDPSAPVRRQRFVVTDSACAVAIGGDYLGVPTAVTASDTPAAAFPDLRHDDEAYVLYTSGSTGTPKGVVITHRNASAFVDWAASAFPLGPGDRVAVHAPLHFDLPVYDVYVGLGAGAEVHPVPERHALFPQALQRFLAERAITHLYAVPSALTALLRRSTVRADGLPALRRVLYAGEEFRAAALAELMHALPQAAVANLYGPIETNVITSHVLDGPPGPDTRVPVGRPVGGALIGLLAADGTASFDGAGEGELVVAGDCVTPGYLGRPDLTAAATVELPTPGGPRRCYRTGDIARRDADGLLHLLGRRDGLVKTRGYRVELGDVEAAAGTHPDVAEVVVVAVPDPELTHRLHALVVPRPGRGGLTGADVLAHCRARLPGYMVPGAVHVVPDLPRTSTGKVARADLPALVTSIGKEV
ncbi:amino acid adenylation domain-containing protein [Lentzea albida]|uniref:Amino acid adenylation domain-containing protein n=1 Tax=Lentzea albida TaxID=65499 RepID=A0A1H9V5X0_9PSEU|nr:amino acid adenylation domain-containing protein [Lentzea albida]SES16968.1 amino acid adenylation domain-containing protein [Lentzea albida]